MNRLNRKSIKEHRIREVKALENELGVIYSQIHNLGYIKLDKPLRHGWYRTFKLRDDISRNKNAKVYVEILEKVVVRIWGSEKKYVDRRWKNYFKRCSHSYLRPGIRYLYKDEYMKLSNKAKRYFGFTRRKSYYNYEKIYHCLLPKYFFQIVYERAYITKRKIIAPELERRSQEIEEILNKTEYYNLSLYKRYHHRDYHNPHTKRRSITKQAINEIDITNYDEVITQLF